MRLMKLILQWFAAIKKSENGALSTKELMKGTPMSPLYERCWNQLAERGKSEIEETSRKVSSCYSML